MIVSNSTDCLAELLTETLTERQAKPLLERPQFKWLGLVDYQEGLRQQENTILALKSDSDFLGRILGLEHFPVITLGRRAHLKVDLLLSSEQLQEDGIQVCEVDRGGQATLHSPGQLVIYPGVDIKRRKQTVRSFVEQIQVTTLETLKDLGVDGLRKTDEGIYTQFGKLVFMGMRVQEGCVRHGLAINISNDLTLFSKIRACGVQEPSLDGLNKYLSIGAEELFYLWAQKFLSLDG